MAIQYRGIEIEKLQLLWPAIAQHLPSQVAAQLGEQLNSIVNSENEDQNEDKMFQFVETCYNQKPDNFKEYTANVMIAIIIELLKIPSSLFVLHKMRLKTSIFSTFSQPWSNDQEKVLAVAESIWKVTTDPSNINHIVMQIHAYNQFTFNVSITLLIGAFGSLVTTNQSEKLPLVPIENVLRDVMMLNIVKNKADQQIMLDFLILFQSFQRMMSLPFARDDSLKDVLAMESLQLDELTLYLKVVIEETNRSIRHQINMDENTLIVHSAQLILSNMDCIMRNCPLI